MTKKNNRFITYQPDLSVKLKQKGAARSIKHLFEKEHVDAINTAIACQRPLLLTGEPGVGKTQLARAAASILNRVFIRHTVDSKTESRDLLWSFDAVARLADAQVGREPNGKNQECGEKLPTANYVRPGPLWWGLNWKSAKGCTGAMQPVNFDGGKPENGVVVLIDEIDKAEIDVPNGLLEALGEGGFHPEGQAESVAGQGEYPFIVITTNRERGLPDAFIRRCVVMSMELPKLPEQEQEFLDLLVKRGAAHCALSDNILKEAATMLIEDRKATRRSPWPGQAEYLDLLRAVEVQGHNGQSHHDLLEMVRPYLFQKGGSL